MEPAGVQAGRAHPHPHPQPMKNKNQEEHTSTPVHHNHHDHHGHNNHQVAVPPPWPFFRALTMWMKETFFPDDPLKQFKNQPFQIRLWMALQYFFPILEWSPHYTWAFFKSDLLSGITVATLSIPQGISYAKLARLPPILGLYSSFVPPLIYAAMGSSRDIAVGTVAIGSLLTASMLGREVGVEDNPLLYLHLVFTATFFAGVFQGALGLLRLGLVVDFLSQATIVGFMAGAATVVSLQQLKSLLGLHHFTQDTDVVSVLTSVFTQTHQWRFKSAALGFPLICLLLMSRYLSKRRPNMFWVSAMTPLACVILGTLVSYFTHAERHGMEVIGELKRGLNPPSWDQIQLHSPFLGVAVKTGIMTALLALAEGIAVGRSFAMLKNYHIDGNKEMIAFGMMNIVGSFTSCYLTAGPFSRTAVNYNAGCKTAASNIVMATAVMLTLLFLTQLFYHTPMVALASIIVSAMLGIIDYDSAIRLWKVDKLDFFICITAYLGVVFANVETGLIIAVGISLLRVLMFVARPRTVALGNLPSSTEYRSFDHYTQAKRVPGILILQICAPIFFANSSYLRERISRWIDEEEDKLNESKTRETNLHYVVLDMSVVSNIDTSGISMINDVRKMMNRRSVEMMLVNPGGEVMKKLSKSDMLDSLGMDNIFLTAENAVMACNFRLQSCKEMVQETISNL